MEECSTIKHCLNVYENASGQQVNLSKSSIRFSASTPDDVQASINGVLGVQTCPNHGRYLGAPSLIGCNMAKVFSFVKEKA
ncbi:hypothetical protein LguiB_011416 [Lonicera macranthoides]